MEPFRQTAHALIKLLEEKKTSTKEIHDALRERVAKVDPSIHAFISLDGDSETPSSISEGLLHGIPIAVKDNICVKGRLTTCCSKILAGFRPPYHATVIERLIGAGSFPLGRTNMDEFAFGSSTETSCYGITRNPWDKERIPGGSSGGSAAAVAADLAIWALGSDTGGSIRQPASLCGVVGLKPTYGRVSRYGLIAFASSLDQIGPVTKDVEDCALLLNVIAGHDERDSTSAERPLPDFRLSLKNDIRGLRIGVPKEYFAEGLDGEVETSVRQAIDTLKRLGGEIKEISLPHSRHVVAVYYLVATAEASSNLARFDGVQYGFRDEAGDLLSTYAQTRAKGFGTEAKRRIMLGTYALSSGYYDAYYLKAQKVRTLIKKDFDEAFTHCDCLIGPVSPTAAFRIGEKINDPLAMYLSDIYTIPVNLAGIPAMSIPCGFTKDALPIGLHLLARPFAEETLFRVAYTFEQNTEFHERKPDVK
ncbi:MAG: Asp-tRNA(Asn)/Glu-tRNA(Gln) amidotransferase subunit GatA [Candidatus Omnitrophica bacterium]|nr:Asp-tRNA(Asn)/Glu-tRNA(Gln) amidotransferase subunit GatA [Candidatus Omnitrophota bacterium]